MANRNSKKKSGSNLQSFLKKNSSQLQHAGRQREQAEKEITLKKKRRLEKKTLLDSVMKKPAETAGSIAIQNFVETFSNADTTLKETTFRKTSNEEKDTLVDFLEMKSSRQTQIFQERAHAEPEHEKLPAVKSQPTGKPFDDSEKEQSEIKESLKKWIQELMNKTLEEQKKWTKGAITDIKKELILSEKNQKKIMNELIKGVVEEYMQPVKNSKIAGSERGVTKSEEEPKRSVIRKNVKKSVPQVEKEKIAKNQQH
ncbi:MAG: hypothetical protein MRK01_05085 [Candidatus Scalindua sp.]|nr:hypothetical protein [Candidatus Scalindua sp.]